MDLKLTKEVPQIPLSLEVIDKDSPNILDLFYNRDIIFDRAIVNAEVVAKENGDIMHRVSHVI